MTRKDYKSIAAAVNSAWRSCANADQRAAVQAVVACLSSRLEEDNPRFDFLDFYINCLGTTSGKD